MNRNRFKTTHSDKKGWTTWFRPKPHTKQKWVIVCCDCGLAHEWRFRTERGRPEYRVRRAEGYSNLARNRMLFEDMRKMLRGRKPRFYGSNKRRIISELP